MYPARNRALRLDLRDLFPSWVGGRLPPIAKKPLCFILYIFIWFVFFPFSVRVESMSHRRLEAIAAKVDQASPLVSDVVVYRPRKKCYQLVDRDIFTRKHLILNLWNDEFEKNKCRNLIMEWNNTVTTVSLHSHKILYKNWHVPHSPLGVEL